MRALIVEDEALLSLLLAQELEDDGWDTVTVPSAERALEVIGRSTFDLALVDLRLPGMQGGPLIRILLSRMPAMRLLVVTGFGKEAAERRELPLDLVILEKPWSRDALRRAVRNAMGLPPLDAPEA